MEKNYFLSILLITIGFSEMISDLYFRQDFISAGESNTISRSNPKVGILYFRNSEGTGERETPFVSISEDSECIKTGVVPSDQVETAKKRASLIDSPPLLNW